MEFVQFVKEIKMRDKTIREMSYSELDNVFNFVRRSLYDFEELNVHKEDIRILMPESFKLMLQYHYRRPIVMQSVNDQIIDAKFFNVEVLPHFKNEIVVYCTKFDLHKELNQPKIYELWTLKKQ